MRRAEKLSVDNRVRGCRFWAASCVGSSTPGREEERGGQAQGRAAGPRGVRRVLPQSGNNTDGARAQRHLGVAGCCANRSPELWFPGSVFPALPAAGPGQQVCGAEKLLRNCGAQLCTSVRCPSAGCSARLRAARAPGNGAARCRPPRGMAERREAQKDACSQLAANAREHLSQGGGRSE